MFCWLCGQQTGKKHTWDSIDGHECGRYKDAVNKKVKKAKRALLRYKFYYDRFVCCLKHNSFRHFMHMESLRSEEDLRNKVALIIKYENGDTVEESLYLSTSKSSKKSKSEQEGSNPNLKDSIDVARLLKDPGYREACASQSTLWIFNAVDKLVQCRRILAMSYVFCYFMFFEPQFYGKMSKELRATNKSLFEDYQQQVNWHEIFYFFSSNKMWNFFPWS